MMFYIILFTWNTGFQVNYVIVDELESAQYWTNTSLTVSSIPADNSDTKVSVTSTKLLIAARLPLANTINCSPAVYSAGEQEI